MIYLFILILYLLVGIYFEEDFVSVVDFNDDGFKEYITNGFNGTELEPAIPILENIFWYIVTILKIGLIFGWPILQVMKKEMYAEINKMMSTFENVEEKSEESAN